MVTNSNDKTKETVDFIWNLAELLRGPYNKDHYRDVILPLCVLRRFDCALEETKEAVLKEYEKLKSSKVKERDIFLNKISGYSFNNTSNYDFQKLLADPDNIAANLRNYINGFSQNIRDIFEHFKFDKEISNLDKHNILYLVLKEFNNVNLHPDVIANYKMGDIFEELIYRFSENAEAGDHFTPREVIRLMVNLLFSNGTNVLTTKGIITTILDPACGTGGMLSVSEKFIRKLNPDAQVEVFGQDFNDQSFAICKSDMLIKGHDASHIVFGDSFVEDGHKGSTFRYLLANPPFGVQWKRQEKFIKDEQKNEGFDGRFGPGVPKISDGSLLFLLHMISKMKTDKEGSRIAIVFNGSPLFSGDAGSGESEIRKWIIENDMLEGIIALPEQMFYNTGIFTYIWILTNRKNDNIENGPVRKGKVQLINATEFYSKMKKSQGDKRNYITEEQISEITQFYGAFKENENCKIFDNEDFGYSKITIERPLKLNFEISKERIEKMKEVSTFQNLARNQKKGAEGEKEIKEGEKLQNKILSMFSNQRPSKKTDLTNFIKPIDSTEDLFTTIYRDRKIFKAELKKLFQQNAIEVKSSVFNAIIKALSESDESAENCVDSIGNIESDSELRDYENVPLKEDIHEYFEREVKPHVPDAWINEEKTKIGYEIPLTRYFYKFTPLRDTKEILAEIKDLEKKIQNHLEKMMSD